MIAKGKIAGFLEKALLADFSVFLIAVFYCKYITKVLFCLGVGLWLAICLLRFKYRFYRHLIPKTPLSKPLLFFGLALIASVIFSLNFYHSQSILFERYLWYFLFFFLGSYLAKGRFNLLVLIGSAALGGIILGAGGIWDHYHPVTGRLFYSFGIHIGFTPFLVFSIPLFFLIGVFGKAKLLRLGSLMAVAALFPCLIANYSRAAWAAVAISVLVISFIRNKKAVLGVLALLAVVFLFLHPSVQQRVKTSVDPAAWGGRIEMYKGAFEIFKDFPVFGAGLGECEKLFPVYMPELGQHLHVHNTFLEVLLETGLIGLTAFLGIFFIFFRNAFKSMRLIQDKDVGAIQLGLSAGILAGLLFALTCTIITVGIQDAVLFWFLLGMGAGIAEHGLRTLDIEKTGETSL